jgi:hypothetical protein
VREAIILQSSFLAVVADVVEALRPIGNALLSFMHMRCAC